MKQASIEEILDEENRAYDDLARAAQNVQRVTRERKALAAFGSALRTGDSQKLTNASDRLRELGLSASIRRDSSKGVAK